MARWIHVAKQFDYSWPDRSAVTHFHDQALGDQFVKDEIADFAVERGYATEGKLDTASRSTKGTGKRKSRAKKEPPAAADAGSDDTVDQPSLADADQSSDRPAVDRDAG
jgi:hypothetical protein